MGKGTVKVIRIKGLKIENPKKYPIVDGRIIIKRGGIGRGDVKYEPPFEGDRIGEKGFLKTKVGLYQDGADRLMSLTPEGKPPVYTVDHYVKTANADILEKQAKVSGTMTSIQYATLFIAIVLLVLTGLIASNLGVINIG